MRSAIVLGAPFILVLLCTEVAGRPLLGVGAGPDDRDPALTLRIEGPTELRTALEGLCQRTGARCVLPAKLKDFPVLPGTFAGTWVDVVAALLHDSGLNYAATPAGTDRPAHLLVETPELGSGRGSDSTPASGSGDPDRAGVAKPQDTGDTPSEAPPGDVALNDAASPPEEPAPQAPASVPQPVMLDGTPAAGAPGQALAMTPFSDAKGNPIVVRTGPAGGAPNAGDTPGWATLPYSDASGNPIAVQITNGPLTLTPFAGPDGQAWPAPPTQPNQKLQYPIPPNVPPNSKQDSK